MVHAFGRDGGSRGSPDDQPKVTLRDSKPSDDPELRRLWRELMDLHVSLDSRFALAQNADQAFVTYAETARSRDDYRVRVAVAEGRLVGFSISCILPNSPVYRSRWIGYINDLCVTAAYRRRGIGELLVKDAVEWLRSNGADSVEVYVARQNEGAQRFWRRIGGRDYLDRLSIELPPDRDGDG